MVPPSLQSSWWQILDVPDDDWDEAVELCHATGSSAESSHLAEIVTERGLVRGRKVWQLHQTMASALGWAAAYEDSQHVVPGATG